MGNPKVLTTEKRKCAHEQCGKEFVIYRKPGRGRGDPRKKFCDKACAAASRKDKPANRVVSKFCNHCGLPYQARTGTQKYCRDCVPDANALRRLLKYNLPDPQYRELLARFDGMCWICKAEPGTDIDHDHDCCPGKTTCGRCTRGMLCKACNRRLIQDHDRWTVLASAYLRAYEGR